MAKTPQLDIARRIVRPLIEKGESTNSRTLQEKYKISHVHFEAAIYAEKARLEILNEVNAKLTPDGIKISDRNKLEAMQRRLEASFDKRVIEAAQKHLNEVVYPKYDRKLEEAQEIMSNRTIFSNKEYLSIVRAFHPDSSTVENRNEAFILFTSKEHRLRPPERERLVKTSSLPSIEEIRRRAEVLKAEDAAKREASRVKAAETRAKKMKEKTDGNV
jgi:hypothetical protein